MHFWADDLGLGALRRTAVAHGDSLPMALRKGQEVVAQPGAIVHQALTPTGLVSHRQLLAERFVEPG